MDFPKAEKKESLTIQVEADLLARVRRETKKKKIKLREAVQFGLEKFLEEAAKK